MFSFRKWPSVVPFHLSAYLSWNIELQGPTGWEGPVGCTSPCPIVSGLSVRTTWCFLQSYWPSAEPSGSSCPWLEPMGWGTSSLPCGLQVRFGWACPEGCRLCPGLCRPAEGVPCLLPQVTVNGSKGEGALDRALKSCVCSCPSGGAGNISHCTFWA